MTDKSSLLKGRSCAMCGAVFDALRSDEWVCGEACLKVLTDRARVATASTEDARRSAEDPDAENQAELAREALQELDGGPDGEVLRIAGALATLASTSSSGQLRLMLAGMAASLIDSALEPYPDVRRAMDLK